MKVFISQPMNGKDEQTILKERAKMISRIKEQYPDAEILESYFEDYKPSTGNVALKYLSKSLELLADADEAWFAPGWQNARGCRIENECAIAYGIPFMNEDTNVDMPKQMAADAIAYIQQLGNHIGKLTEKVAQFEATHPRWINTRDELPAPETRVLASAIDNDGESIVVITEYTHHLYGLGLTGWIEPWQYFSWNYKITHWMPLPESPKEGE